MVCIAKLLRLKHHAISLANFTAEEDKVFLEEFEGAKEEDEDNVDGSKEKFEVDTVKHSNLVKRLKVYGDVVQGIKDGFYGDQSNINLFCL